MDDFVDQGSPQRMSKGAVGTALSWRGDFTRRRNRADLTNLLTSAGLCVLLALLIKLLFPDLGESVSAGPIGTAVTVALLILLAAAVFGSMYQVVKAGERFAVHVACESCGNRFSTSLRWQCGFCQSHNSSPPWRHNILGTCAHCEAVTPAYECHFCGHANALADGWDGRHVARHGEKPWRPASGDTHEDVRKRRAQERELTEDSTQLTRAQIERLKAEMELLKTEQQVARVAELKKASPKEPTKDELIDQFDQQLARDFDVLLAKATTHAEARQRLQLRLDEFRVRLDSRSLDDDQKDRLWARAQAHADRLEQSFS